MVSVRRIHSEIQTLETKLIGNYTYMYMYIVNYQMHDCICAQR